MSTIIYGRGSKHLAGAASLKHRMPVIGVASCLDIAQMVEQQSQKLLVAGSIPAFQTTCLVGNRMSRVPAFVPVDRSY